MQQHHYFLNTTHEESDYFTFTDYFLSRPYTFKSCSDIFSKDTFDYGTTLLLKTIIDKFTLNGSVLDVGCGYGIIGIMLKIYYPDLKVTCLDINKTAVQLTKENAISFKVDIEALESNLYDNIGTKYTHIVTNPPIKAGKENLFNVVTKGYIVLEDGGDITLVIKKKHGMESLKKHMQDVFGNVEILKKDKGYYILYSKKSA